MRLAPGKRVGPDIRKRLEWRVLFFASCVRTLVLIGKDRDAIRAVAPASLEVRDADSMAEAVRIAAEEAQAGDRVLLSPACASFDMYSGFEVRGDDFGEMVRRIQG